MDSKEERHEMHSHSRNDSKAMNGHQSLLKSASGISSQQHSVNGSGNGDASATSQDEVEQLRQMVKKLERQNRHLLRQQKHLLVQQKQQLQLPSAPSPSLPQDPSLTSIGPDDLDRMSIASQSTMVASFYAGGGANDDASSIFSAADSHVLVPTPTPSRTHQHANPTPSAATPQRSSRTSHRATHVTKSHSVAATGATPATDPALVNGKYAEDSWLYRVPRKTTSTVQQPSSKSKLTEEESQLVASPVEWLREVFDSPRVVPPTPKVQTPSRDWLLERLNELRLTGRMSRWSSASALASSPFTSQAATFPATSRALQRTPTALATTVPSTFFASTSRTQPQIKSPTSIMAALHPARTSLGSLGSLVNASPLPPETPVPTSAAQRRDSLVAALNNNIAIQDVVAIAKQQQELLKQHAVLQQQQRTSRSRSRPAPEERPPSEVESFVVSPSSVRRP